jgi:hypothetical protein
LALRVDVAAHALDERGEPCVGPKLRAENRTPVDEVVVPISRMDGTFQPVERAVRVFRRAAAAAISTRSAGVSLPASIFCRATRSASSTSASPRTVSPRLTSA